MKMVQHLKRTVINMKMRRKILLIFLLVGVLPFLCYIIFSNRYTNQIMLERETSLTESALAQAVQSVENKLETYNNLSNYMFNNTSILQALNTEYHKDYFKMYKAYQDTIEPLLQTYYALHPDLENITIYSSCDLHPYNGYVVSLEELKEKEYYPLVRNNFIPAWLVTEEEGTRYLYSIRLIGDTGRYKNVNYLSLKLNYDSLFDPLLHVSEDNYSVLITDSNGTEIFSFPGISPSAASSSVIFSSDISSSVTSSAAAYGSADSSRCIQLTAQLPATGWTVTYFKSYQVLLGYVNSITRRIYAFGWIILLFLGVMVLMISVSIVSPIEVLTAKIKEVRDAGLQTLSVRLDNERKDEIGILFENFSSMMEEIHHYVEVNLKNELEKKTYQQKILYAQINPHFLYNSLSLINSRAIISGQDEISNMVLLLSTFYRTALNKGRDITTLENELLNIQSYVQIQLLSYSEPIQVSYDIDYALSGMRFPNFILQPLVENALDHGLKNSARPDKILRLTADRETVCLDQETGCLDRDTEYIVIRIEDNGVGMDEDTVRLLFEVQTHGYGMKNVNDRLRLLYGRDYSLVIRSTPGKGTQAVLMVPIDDAENQ
ncbi:sensor histidine kinase [Eisenbergiella sp.]